MFLCERVFLMSKRCHFWRGLPLLELHKNPEGFSGIFWWTFWYSFGHGCCHMLVTQAIVVHGATGGQPYCFSIVAPSMANTSPLYLASLWWWSWS